MLNKTHGYLTIEENGAGFVTASAPQFDVDAGGSSLILDAEGNRTFSVLVAQEVEKLFGGRPVPEAPVDKYPHGRTFIVRLDEVGE